MNMNDSKKTPEIQEIPITWKKPHNSLTIFHTGTLSILLDDFIKRYSERLKIRSIMIDLEMPKDGAGFPNGVFIIKLHVTLDSGEILRAEGEERSIPDAMKKIVIEIDNESRKTDRQKHHDSSRKLGC